MIFKGKIIKETKYEYCFESEDAETFGKEMMERFKTEFDPMPIDEKTYILSINCVDRKNRGDGFAQGGVIDKDDPDIAPRVLTPSTTFHIDDFSGLTELLFNDSVDMDESMEKLNKFASARKTDTDIV